jgi:chaperonin cofactor prefoldin
MTADMFSQLLPIVVTAVLTAVGTYIGAIHQLKTKVTVLEQKVERMDKRLEKKSGQFDEIQKELAEIKGILTMTLNLMKQGVDI